MPTRSAVHGPVSLATSPAALHALLPSHLDGPAPLGVFRAARQSGSNRAGADCPPGSGEEEQVDVAGGVSADDEVRGAEHEGEREGQENDAGLGEQEKEEEGGGEEEGDGGNVRGKPLLDERVLGRGQAEEQEEGHRGDQPEARLAPAEGRRPLLVVHVAASRRDARRALDGCAPRCDVADAARFARLLRRVDGNHFGNPRAC